MRSGFWPRETPDPPAAWIPGQARDNGERGRGQNKKRREPWGRGVLEATRRT